MPSILVSSGLPFKEVTVDEEPTEKKENKLRNRSEELKKK